MVVWADLHFENRKKKKRQGINCQTFLQKSTQGRKKSLSWPYPDLHWLSLCRQSVICCSTQTSSNTVHVWQVTNYLLDPTRLYDEEQTYKASLEIEPKQSRLSMTTNPSWGVLSQRCAVLDDAGPGCKIRVAQADLLLFLQPQARICHTLLRCCRDPNKHPARICNIIVVSLLPSTARWESVTLLQCCCYPHAAGEPVTPSRRYCRCHHQRYSSSQAGLDPVAVGNV